MTIEGTYERVKVENYEEFLKALDVNFLLRKAATASTPVMIVSDARKWNHIYPLGFRETWTRDIPEINCSKLKMEFARFEVSYFA